ncbi:MAG: hypothetical protein ACYDHY_07825 [Acidiferrobacterales bacterium]
MKIKKSVLERFVREELQKHISSLLEAPTVGDSQEDNLEKEKEKDEAEPGKNGNMVTGGEGNELPAEDDPADDQLDKVGPEADVADAEVKKDAKGEKAKEAKPDEPKDTEQDIEDAEDVTGGEIADKVAGQTVQSISLNPKSKLMPGAQEIEIQWAALPEPLKILVNKSGQIYFYMGGLHKTL